MDRKKQIHEEIMGFLDNYLEKTPKEIIQNDIAEVSKLDFAGTSAEDYFSNFHKHFEGSKEKLHYQLPFKKAIDETQQTLFYIFNEPSLKLTIRLSNKDFNSITLTEDENIYNRESKKYDYV